GVIPIFHLLKCHTTEVATDPDGIVADDLERILRNWPRDTPRPKLLYTVPYGCNPTGASATLERRLKVLHLAREFEFLIFEDDPYFYLYFGDVPRSPSYFQLEKEIPGTLGHVMRFDSFSKVLSSGMRIGFVSGPNPIITAMNRFTSSSMLQPPGLTQAVTYSLLSHWGYEGFQQHVDYLASVYRRKRDLFVAAMQMHLTGLAEWSIPEAGLFVWFKVFLPPVPGSQEGDSEDLIVRRALKEKVLALPGTAFFTNGRTSAYVRASFSMLPEEHFNEAMRRLAAVIREAREETETKIFNGRIAGALSSSGGLGYSTSNANKRMFPPSYYDRYLSDKAQRCLPCPIRNLIGPSRIPGMLSLFSGSPAPETFPYRALTLTISYPDTPNRDKSSRVELDGDLLGEALQYSDTGGMRRFVDWLYGLQERYHQRRHDEEGWSSSVGCGGQDLLFKAFTCLLDEGDSILVESPVYAGVIPIFHLLKCHTTEVSTDPNGIVADDLERILRNWPRDTPRPKLLYTVPYGCNPTGASATLERRLKVLNLAREFEFLIFEDDPYFYLYFGNAPRSPSYFQLEKEIPGTIGHVMRFDSFSKVLSSGMRIAFVSGPNPIITAMNRFTASSMLQPPGLTQAVTYSLLAHWGYEGFQQHIDYLGSVYRRKRDLFVAAMQMHLTGLAEWSIPEAGLFVWFKVFLPPVPGSPEGDSEDLIVRRAFKEKVLALPGTAFFTNGRTSAYVRASFSMLPEEHFNEAMRRLAAVIKEAREETETQARL
ncbi:hypothetical protein FRC01_013327, partial [Tulasnella sp. 417]